MKVNPQTADDVLRMAKANDCCYHALNSDSVAILLEFADEFKYRKPKNANGSRARYFHAYLLRCAARES